MNKRDKRCIQKYDPCSFSFNIGSIPGATTMKLFQVLETMSGIHVSKDAIK